MPLNSEGQRLVVNKATLAMASTLSVTLGALLIALLTTRPAMWCVNDMSRWDTVWSLVERGTYAIGTDAEPEPWATIDKVKVGDRYYSSKPPLFPTVMAGEYWLIKRLTGWTIREQTDRVCKTIIAITNVLPMCALVWFYGVYLSRHVKSRWARSFWLVTAVIGTYLTGYTVTINNHTVCAIATFFAMYLMVRIVYEKRGQWHDYILLGLATGWAFANETSAALLVVAIFIALGLRGDSRTWTLALPATAVVIAAWAVTNYLAIGYWLPAQLLKESTDLYKYPGSYWHSPQGIDAQHEPKWLYVLHSTLGHHGIFSLSPVLAFAIVGAVVFLSGRSRELPALQWIAIVVSLLAYAGYVGKTGNYGGGAKGFRWMFWCVPMWLMAAPLSAHVWAKPAWVRAVALAALAVSVFTVVDALNSPWGQSWLHRMMAQMGLVAY